MSDISGKKQDTKFKKGVSGNPAGRPKGSISIIGRIKQKFEEDPKYFDEWINKFLEDANNRKAVMHQIDGSPAQSVDLTTKGEKLPTPLYGGASIQIQGHNSDTQDIRASEED